MEERLADAVHDSVGGEDSLRSSLGRYLASQRQVRGVSLEELAARTRIPTRNLERLESGAMDGESDGFSRGLVRIVALALGLDPDDAVMRLVSEPSEDVGARKRSMRNTRLLRVGLLASGAVLLALLWKLLASWIAPGAGGEAPSLVYRRDAVRALAAEQAAGGVPEAQVSSPPGESR